MAYVKAMENAGPHITALYTPISLFRRFYVNFCISLLNFLFIRITAPSTEESSAQVSEQAQVSPTLTKYGFSSSPLFAYYFMQPSS